MKINKDGQKAWEKYTKRLFLLPVLAVFITAAAAYVREEAILGLVRDVVLAALLTGMLTGYVRLYAESILTRRNAFAILLSGYLLSLLLLYVVKEPELYTFWMLGGLVLSIWLDQRLGLFVQLNMIALMGISLTTRYDMLLISLIVCALMNMLSGAFEKKATVIYAVVVTLSVYITLICAVNQFELNNIIDNRDYLIVLLSMLAVMAAAFLLSVSFPILQRKKKAVEDEAVKQEKLISMEGTSYYVLCNLDNILLKRLKGYSESLYQHSIEIGELSARAAKEIGADEMLSRAGGIYHEIGRINGKNYLEEGIRLAEEYAFPKELVSILKEYNSKTDRPTSAEAAIVMLSDNVVSALGYIHKSGDLSYTAQKVIEKIFQIRINKGTLDQSGITMTQLQTLKELFQKEFCRSEKASEEQTAIGM